MRTEYTHTDGSKINYYAKYACHYAL